MASVGVAVRVEKRYSALLEGPTGYYPLESLRFLNGKVGWAVGSAQILKTLNGGRSWTNHYPQQFSEDSLSPEVACPVDPYICWLLAYRGNQHLRCLVTRDSGCTWSEKYRLPPSLYADIFFLDRLYGWVLRADKASKSSLHSTGDAGAHWTDIALKLGGVPRAILFVDKRKGWLLENHSRRGSIFRKSALHTTEDGGATWGRVAEFSGEAWSFRLCGHESIYVVGAKGMLLRATVADGKVERLASHTHADFYDVHFKGPIGVAIGTSDLIVSPRSVALLVSRDSGETWHRIPFPVAGSFFCIHLATWQSGILASSRGLYTFQLR